MELRTESHRLVTKCWKIFRWFLYKNPYLECQIETINNKLDLQLSIFERTVRWSEYPRFIKIAGASLGRDALGHELPSPSVFIIKNSSNRGHRTRSNDIPRHNQSQQDYISPGAPAPN